jgi:hypothetical protein
MKRTQSIRTFAPALNTLEDRCLLNGAPHHASPAMMMMGKGPSTVSLVSSTISSDMSEVTLTIKVSDAKATMMGETPPTPTGKVVLEMIMKKGSHVKGMHAGVNKLVTVSLVNGEAVLTEAASKVLNTKLEILYNGNSMYKPSSVTPAVLTMTGVMASSGMGTSGMSTTGKSGMGGMNM